MFAKDLLQAGVAALAAAQVDNAPLDARLLLEHALGMSREQLLVDMEREINNDEQARYEAMIVRRATREPVSHILGKREFWGMEFSVSSATLDPRPDSETLIEAALARMPDRHKFLNILDLGTGTGCLLLSLLKELPNASGTGVDMSEDALKIAKNNALELGLQGRATFMQSNWCDHIEQKFDIIISNPPYIPTKTIDSLAPEVAHFEPKLALDGGEDGLDCYRELFASLPKIMAHDSFAVFEIGMDQQVPLATIIAQHGLQLADMKKDLSGIIRCLIVTHPLIKDEGHS
jgi:release factor glutamine methyltransferase